MGTADARLKLAVQFSGIPIFSPAPYLGLGHLVGGCFWRNVINFIVRTMLFYFWGWYGMIENYPINTIICITVQVWQTLHFILAESWYLKLSVLDVVFSFKKCHESNRAPKKVKVTFSLQFLYQSKPQEMLSSQQCLERNQNIFTTGSDKLDKSEICMFSVYDPHQCHRLT